MINIEASGSDIIYWGRDESDNVYKKKIDDFYPYFYAESESGQYTSVFGEKLKRIITRLPGDVPRERTMYDRHYEADILYTNRFSIDRFDDIKKERIRICFLDIETESGPKAPTRFPDVNNPLNKVTTICVYDNFEIKYKIFALGPEVEFDLCEIEWFDDDTSLLKSFCKYIKKTDFDLLSGYWIERFDMPYIINRMRLLKLNMTSLSRDTVQTYIDNYDHCKIWGRNIFDVYWGIRTLKSGERPSWKLGDVCQEELGYGKTEYTGELYDLYEKDKKKFLKYNFTDVKLLIDLDKKFGMINYFDEVRRMSKVTWEHVFTTSMVNDSLLLQFCKDKYVLPSIPKGRKKVDYEGALTEVYGSGLFKNVLVFDWRSLYPTLMMLYNISFETVSEKFTDIRVGNGTYFRKDKLGIVPDVLYMLYNKRNEYKTEMKKYDFGTENYSVFWARQHAYKIRSNSFYGLFGYTGSRIYNVKCAGSTTYLGKKVIQKTIDVASKHKLKVLYAHTDSIYFTVEGDYAKEELKKLGKDICKKVELEVRKIVPKQELLPDVTLDLEFEAICQSAFFNKFARNRNARMIVYEDDKFLDKPKLKVTGFQSIRSDTPKLVQNLLNEVFTMILSFKTEEEVLGVINKFKDMFMSGKFDISDISIPTGVKVEVPGEIVKGLAYHVKGCVHSNLHFNTNLKKGSKVKVCYVKVNSYNIDVISFSYNFPKQLEVDYKKMWKRYVNIFVDIFKCMNWYSLKTGSTALTTFKDKKMKSKSEKSTVSFLNKFKK